MTRPRKRRPRTAFAREAAARDRAHLLALAETQAEIDRILAAMQARALADAEPDPPWDAHG